MDPWITVVTPALNQGAFLADAIASVRAQGDGVEHIVVEGGSNDDTAAVLARHPHLVALRDPGIGQSHAVNIGFRAAHGEVIGWLNADDRYADGAFQGVRRAFAAHPNADLIYGNCRFIDADGKVTAEHSPGPFNLNALLNGWNRIAQPAVFFRSPLLEKIGLLDEELQYVMDFEYWLRAARTTQPVWVDEVWADFRVHGGSKTGGDGYEAFWPEKRRIARRYGGPFFSESWKVREKERVGRVVRGVIQRLRLR